MLAVIFAMVLAAFDTTAFFAGALTCGFSGAFAGAFATGFTAVAGAVAVFGIAFGLALAFEGIFFAVAI